MSLEDRLGHLREIIRGTDRLLVAFSGGVDSSFLLRIAVDELGDRVTALTTNSPTGAQEDLEIALSLARELGVMHRVVDHNELEIPGYAGNPINRCYFCKHSLYDICRAAAVELGISTIADGVNTDDLGDYRPGLKAASEGAIRHPLVEAGLSKNDIRVLSRKLGLRTWDKPSSPCLSSRFPYGTPITLDGLHKVGGGEQVLHRLGFRECRVRYHETTARIEVPAAELPRLVDPEVRAILVREFKQLGFLYVTVDLQGFRSGSLNEALATSPTTDPPAS